MPGNRTWHPGQPRGQHQAAHACPQPAQRPQLPSSTQRQPSARNSHAARDGSLPARAAPGAGCNALGSATPRSRGCCRPAGRDAVRPQVPPDRGAPGQPRQRQRSRGPCKRQMGHPQPSPPASRAQPLPREAQNPAGTVACPAPGWAPLQELGLPCRHWPQPRGTGPSSTTPAARTPSTHGPGARSSCPRGAGDLSGLHPSSLGRGRAHAARGCPQTQCMQRAAPGRHSRSPQHSQDQERAAASSKGLRVTKEGRIKHPGLAQTGTTTALQGVCALLLEDASVSVQTWSKLLSKHKHIQRMCPMGTGKV